jgi:hypothetical protein
MRHTLSVLLTFLLALAVGCGTKSMPAENGKADANAPRPNGSSRDVTPSGETRDETIAELVLPVPKEWETRPVSSKMRLAQFVLPGPGGDAELVVYRFPGGAGGAQANIDRWKGQFQAPEGKSIDDVTKTTSFQAGNLKVTLVDVSGHYSAPERPGSSTMVDVPDARMLSAMIEGSGDAFFLKALGPRKTIEVWAKAYEDMLRAVRAR